MARSPQVGRTCTRHATSSDFHDEALRCVRLASHSAPSSSTVTRAARGSMYSPRADETVTPARYSSASTFLRNPAISRDWCAGSRYRTRYRRPDAVSYGSMLPMDTVTPRRNGSRSHRRTRTPTTDSTTITPKSPAPVSSCVTATQPTQICSAPLVSVLSASRVTCPVTCPSELPSVSNAFLLSEGDPEAAQRRWQARTGQDARGVCRTACRVRSLFRQAMRARVARRWCRPSSRRGPLEARVVRA